MPVRKECPERLNRDGIAVVPEAVMSSGSGIMSGFMGPVGWLETASAQLCVVRQECTPCGICSTGFSP